MFALITAWLKRKFTQITFWVAIIGLSTTRLVADGTTELLFWLLLFIGDEGFGNFVKWIAPKATKGLEDLENRESGNAP